MEETVAKIQQLIALYGLKIIAALVIIIVGRWIAKWIRRGMERVLTHREIEPMLVSFVGEVMYVALLLFIIIAALSQLGIQTTSLIAAVGAAGLAVGLALKDSLSNLAAGIMMIVLGPFKSGDSIQGGGASGTVEEISFFTTRLRTVDNTTVIVPNGKMMGDTIVNLSDRETRRIDLVIGVGYNDDLAKVRSVLREISDSDERILKDPVPVIAVSELADSSVNLAYRIWVKTPDYLDVRFAVTEKVKERFDEEGISMPFPQRDVHLFNCN
jgi:small conductance mechanosensitive channel